MKPDTSQPIEPSFLSNAKENRVKLIIGQMNRSEHEGFIQDIGRYEINIEENGKTITLLKQEISYLAAPQPILAVPPPLAAEPAQDQPSIAADSPPGRPNIQQEFLDKAIRESQFLTLFLINGQRIKANVEAYDNFTILLREGGRQLLYYKHAVTTINR